MSKHFPLHFPLYVSTDDETVRKIWSFVSLENGWCYGHGGPANFYVAIYATNVVSLLKCNSMQSTDAFPGEDGSILVTGYAGDYTIEVYCEIDGNFKVVVEENDEEIEAIDSSSLENVCYELRKRAKMWDGSHDCFTQSTSIKRGGAIVAQHFSLPAMEGGHQLLIFHV